MKRPWIAALAGVLVLVVAAAVLSQVVNTSAAISGAGFSGTWVSGNCVQASSTFGFLSTASAPCGSGGGGGVTGSGTANFIPIWTSSTALGNSTIQTTTVVPLVNNGYLLGSGSGNAQNGVIGSDQNNGELYLYATTSSSAGAGIVILRTNNAAPSCLNTLSLIAISGANDAYLNLPCTTYAHLGTPGGGSMVYCNDCTVNGISSACTGSGTGAMAFYSQNAQVSKRWVCPF
jgi:hypothetical protein